MTTEHPHGSVALDREAARFWEAHYQAQPSVSGPRGNPLLTEVVASLVPGSALDLGCGAGGDTLWLATQGWQVTAVDISATAVDRVTENARSWDVADHVAAERHDLSHSFPSGSFDLVFAQYLHSPGALARHQVLRAAAQAVLPGGRLLVVDHGSVAPWSWNQDTTEHFPTPEEVVAELDLDPSLWVIERADTPTRQAVGPGGQSAQVVDHVLIMRRRHHLPRPDRSKHPFSSRGA